MDFISDLHLDPARTAVIDGFIDWIGRQAGHAEALYILGDLFEVWIGDDDTSPLCRQVSDALRHCAESGTPVTLMHGNRDFLIGEKFLHDSACQLLADPAVIDLYGRRALLMHGDLLCSDDHEYQEIRRTVRDPLWQESILAKPLQERRQLAMQLRAESRQSVLGKRDDIMDVSPDTVIRFMTQHKVDLLIHGHTHRPGVHKTGRRRGQTPLTRVVLGDWGDRGSVLHALPGGELRLEALPL